MGKTMGDASSTQKKLKNYNVTLTGTRNSSSIDGTEIAELTISNVSDVIDTTDSDSDGYYFVITNGNLELQKTN